MQPDGNPWPPIFKDAAGRAVYRGTQLLARHAQWSEWVLLVNPQLSTHGDPNELRRVRSLMDGAFRRIFNSPQHIRTFMHTVARTGPGAMDDAIVTIDAAGVHHVDERGARQRSLETQRRRDRLGEHTMPDVDWSNDRYDATHVFAQTWSVDYEVGGRLNRVHAMVTFRVLHDSAFRVNMDPGDPTSFPFLFSAEFNAEARAQVAAGHLSQQEYEDRYMRAINARAPPYKPGVYAKVMSARSLYDTYAVEYKKKDTLERGTWTRRPAGYPAGHTFARGAVRDVGQITFPPPPAGSALEEEEFPPAAPPEEYAQARYVRPAARRRRR